MAKTNSEKIKRVSNCEKKNKVNIDNNESGKQITGELKDSELEKEDINYSYEYICPNCKFPVIVIDRKRGEIRCDKCGTILEEQIISLEKEWRVFDDESSGVIRSGGSTKDSQWDKGLTTKVGIGYIDAYGVPISTQSKIKHARLRKLQNRIKLVNTKDRNFVLVLSKVDRILSTLEVGNRMEYMKNECAYIYKKAMEKGLTKGKNHQGMAAAIVYILCKVDKIPFQFLDISKAADVARQLMWKYIKALQPVIEESHSDRIKTTPNKECQNNAGTNNAGIKSSIRSIPEDYLNKFADRWNLPPDIEERAKEILKSTGKGGVLSGRSPAGFAAAALYIAAGEKNIEIKLSLIREVKYLTLMNKIKMLEKLV
ncbi:MAG: hypothetical protein BWK75_02665 [Candidatus Altiarchaeales archaeon A3]|nr:MAG: hypothetical protein BWK75_02665 [Candidatus Altiarchaeales archaeon A3]